MEIQNSSTPDFIKNSEEKRLSAAESLPIELLRYALAIQYGYQLHWSAMRALIRNGLISRRFGTWVLTTTGLSAAGLARRGVEAGEISLQGVGLAANRRAQPQGFLDPTGEQTGADLERGIEGQVSRVAGLPGGSVAVNDVNTFRHGNTLAGLDPHERERLERELDWSNRNIGMDTGRFFGVGDSGMDESFMRQGSDHKPAEQSGSVPDEVGVEAEQLENRLAEIPGLTRRPEVADSEVDGKLDMSFSVALGVKGWRWTTISSTGYRDTDGELITRAALAVDVARADKDGDYGPLVWWHEYEPLLVHEGTGQHLLYEALVFGYCDFNSMAGPESQFLLESGTFINEKVAMAIVENASKLAVSIKFTYDDRDLDEDGVYHRIRRRERSLLPRGKEANLFTGVTAQHLIR